MTTTLTPDAKRQLSTTIRQLRELLLERLQGEAERHYRLSVPLAKAGLNEERSRHRERLEAWLDERVRAADSKDKGGRDAARARFLGDAVKEAAATLLNRLVLIRHLEALGLSRPAIVTGGWNSKGYRAFRDVGPGLTGDETEGYQALLQLLFDELALDLPGLFGDVGLTRLFPVTAATLREVVERLDAPGLASAWTDDTTLGWVYQYWNDPEREKLDEKISGGGKIEPHEIAAKTQMFTERYMVEWLLHNSLGLTWLCICRKNGWTADAEQVLPVLDARRAEWRTKREAGSVALDALMPIDGELEEHWKYYVPQPIPEDAVAKAPDSVSELRLLDPACGSGHFLVIAFDLLVALYREEARHRGQTISDREIAESILEVNLHGVDIDPRAIQIAAAGLFLKARALAKDARPKHLNLVAPVLNLASLPKDDPALVRLRRELKAEAGIPEALTNTIVQALAGVDHLGTLLKVDATVEDSIRDSNLLVERTQTDFFKEAPPQQVKIDFKQARETVLDKLEQFLARHTGEEDLGLRLDGEQLAAGVRFTRIVKEESYDLVIGNPPYQGTARMVDPGYVAKQYPCGKQDLYAAFIERGLELTRSGGISALVAMRGWMFLGQFTQLRERVLRLADLRSLADLGTGAFGSRSMDDVISTVLVIWRNASPAPETSVAIRASPLIDKARDSGKPRRRCASLLVQDPVVPFQSGAFNKIEGEPVVYWWSTEFINRYTQTEKLSDKHPARFGVNTGNNQRFTRLWWEAAQTTINLSRHRQHHIHATGYAWAPFIGGAKGIAWWEPLRNIVRWSNDALELRAFGEVSIGSAIRNPMFQFQEGVAFAMIGNSFSARIHRYKSVFGDKGSSVFPIDVASVTCLLNTTSSRFILQSLNPSISFQVGDVNRLPVFPIASADEIFATLDRAFTEHEAAREASVEFKHPGHSPWTSAQAWAQLAVDRPAGEPLPPYESVYEQPSPEHFVSFALGVVLGRFGANREGVLNEAPASALPAGILFLSADSEKDSLAHPACDPLLKAWETHGAAVGGGDDLRTFLRKSFFAHHKEAYENRPIYFPLSSAKKSFVAWISIHRWQANTFSTLLADHLLPERRRLEGELDDLRRARAEPDKGTKTRAERRFADAQRLREELVKFIEDVTQCADKGPPTEDKLPPRETDARFAMDLDDGVMVNSAALWPLLEPQWKDPKKWWKELATAKGRKDYDWSHLAARYFPDRVAKKCVEDPSLAVAHGCFWALHPAKAYAWELRLQDELRPDFTIDEPGSNEARARFLAKHEHEARELRAAEKSRRERKARKGAAEDDAGPLFAEDADEEPESANE